MSEPLAVLLLPARLERFELAGHARELLDIPRVVALEPPRLRSSGLWTDALTARYARRARFPGEPRLLVLYHPRQYPLARALLARFEDVELWYARPDRARLRDAAQAGSEDLLSLDDRAAERAAHTLLVSREGDPRYQNEPLRRRLLELEIISARPFVPGARIHYR